MDIPINQARISAQKSLLIRSALAIAYLVCLNLAFRGTDHLLANFDGPAWLRLVILALPWLVVLAFYPIYRRFWRKDELEKLINYQAISFAFYGLLIAVVVVGQLQSAGFLPTFKWHTGVLLLAIMGLLLAGMGWSKWRYR